MGRVIVLAIDGSAHSKRAVEYYTTDVLREGDLVLFTHIFHAPHPPLPDLSRSASEAWEEWRKDVDQQLNDMKKMVAEHELMCKDKPITVKGILHSGTSPTHGICDVAQNHNATMIIIGSRGHNAIRRTFLGSVSDYVLHHAHIPVIVVPNPAA